MAAGHHVRVDIGVRLKHRMLGCRMHWFSSNEGSLSFTLLNKETP